MLLPVLLTALQDRETPPRAITMVLTENGRQVEVAVAPKPGDLAVVTPYGVLHTPRDPVAVVHEDRLDRSWASALEKDPDAPLLPWIQAADGSGRLTELRELAAYAHEHGRGAEAVAAFRAAEKWGAELDPVPKDIPYDQRVDWIWTRIVKDPTAGSVYLSGWLTEEVEANGVGVGNRQVLIRDLNDGLKSRSPFLQRAAARVAGVERPNDPFLGTRVLVRSLEGDPLVEDAAAEAIARMWPAQAREWWIQTLMRDEEDLRVRAAWHLARFLPDDAAKPLALTLSAAGRRAPERYAYAGKTLQLVNERQEPEAVFAADHMFIEKQWMWQTERIESVTAVKLVKPSDALAAEIAKALALVAGDSVERNRQAWLDWYAAR